MNEKIATKAIFIYKTFLHKKSLRLIQDLISLNKINCQGQGQGQGRKRITVSEWLYKEFFEISSKYVPESFMQRSRVGVGFQHASAVQVRVIN